MHTCPPESYILEQLSPLTGGTEKDRAAFRHLLESTFCQDCRRTNLEILTAIEWMEHLEPSEAFVKWRHVQQALLTGSWPEVLNTDTGLAAAGLAKFYGLSFQTELSIKAASLTEACADATTNRWLGATLRGSALAWRLRAAQQRDDFATGRRLARAALEQTGKGASGLARHQIILNASELYCRTHEYRRARFWCEKGLLALDAAGDSHWDLTAASYRMLRASISFFLDEKPVEVIEDALQAIRRFPPIFLDHIRLSRLNLLFFLSEMETPMSQCRDLLEREALLSPFGLDTLEARRQWAIGRIKLRMGDLLSAEELFRFASDTFMTHGQTLTALCVKVDICCCWLERGLFAKSFEEMEVIVSRLQADQGLGTALSHGIRILQKALARRVISSSLLSWFTRLAIRYT